MVRFDNNNVMLFGGANANETFNDVWVLNIHRTSSFAYWTKIKHASKKTAPPACVGHTMSLIDGRVVITGGRDPKKRSFYSGVWILDIVGKKCRTRSSTNYNSLARAGHSAIQDRDGSILIFGGLGSCGNYPNDMLRLCLVGADLTD